MNVSCPDCRSIFRVDPAKVPPAGVRARCSVCSGVITIPAPTGQTTPSGGNVRAQTPATPAERGRATPPTQGAWDSPPYGGAARQTPAAPPIQRPASAPPPGSTPAIGDGGARRPLNPFLSRDPDQRAKRLARALVSDIVTYHPAKHAEGLRDGTLKQLFREEIKKSFEEYIAQVGQPLAEGTTYFQEALNEVLAAGKKIF